MYIEKEKYKNYFHDFIKENNFKKADKLLEKIIEKDSFVLNLMLKMSLVADNEDAMLKIFKKYHISDSIKFKENIEKLYYKQLKTNKFNLYLKEEIKNKEIILDSKKFLNEIQENPYFLIGREKNKLTEELEYLNLKNVSKQWIIKNINTFIYLNKTQESVKIIFKLFKDGMWFDNSDLKKMVNAIKKDILSVNDSEQKDKMLLFITLINSLDNHYEKNKCIDYFIKDINENIQSIELKNLILNLKIDNKIKNSANNEVKIENKKVKI